MHRMVGPRLMASLVVDFAIALPLRHLTRPALSRIPESNPALEPLPARRRKQEETGMAMMAGEGEWEGEGARRQSLRVARNNPPLCRAGVRVPLGPRT